MKRALVAIVLVLLAGGAVGTAMLRDAVYGEPAPADSVMYIRSGDVLSHASLSNASLLADVYWIRAIQYYGAAHVSQSSSAIRQRYALLYPLLDVVTTLDPKFNIAYRFGAIFLAERFPGGPGRPDLSIALLEKGLRNNPDKWQYEHDRGFIYYWYLHDYNKAADAFEHGASIKGAPWWMSSFAAVTRGKGGDREGSRRLWQQLADMGDNEWLRNNALWRIAQLDAVDQIEQLQAIVAAMYRRTGFRPESWRTVVRAGWLRAEPTDPSGTPYVLDAETGRVSLSSTSKLYPLPTEANGWIPDPPK